VLTQNSPATNSKLHANPSYRTGFRLYFEVTVKPDPFGAVGFGYPASPRCTRAPARPGGVRTAGRGHVRHPPVNQPPHRHGGEPVARGRHRCRCRSRQRSRGAAAHLQRNGPPAGLSISSAGLISGRSRAGGRTHTVNVTASDPQGASGSASFTWTVRRPTAFRSAGDGYTPPADRRWKSQRRVWGTTRSDMDSLTAVLVTGPSSGSLTLNPKGRSATRRRRVQWNGHIHYKVQDEDAGKATRSRSP